MIKSNPESFRPKWSFVESIPGRRWAASSQTWWTSRTRRHAPWKTSLGTTWGQYYDNLANFRRIFGEFSAIFSEFLARNRVFLKTNVMIIFCHFFQFCAKILIFGGEWEWDHRPLVPILLLVPQFFLIILFLSTTLSNRMTGIYLLGHAMTSD
jgi:hypothetical protein